MRWPIARYPARISARRRSMSSSDQNSTSPASAESKFPNRSRLSQPGSRRRTRRRSAISARGPPPPRREIEIPSPAAKSAAPENAAISALPSAWMPSTVAGSSSSVTSFSTSSRSARVSPVCSSRSPQALPSASSAPPRVPRTVRAAPPTWPSTISRSEPKALARSPPTAKATIISFCASVKVVPDLRSCESPRSGSSSASAS